MTDSIDLLCGNLRGKINNDYGQTDILKKYNDEKYLNLLFKCYEIEKEQKEMQNKEIRREIRNREMQIRERQKQEKERQKQEKENHNDKMVNGAMMTALIAMGLYGYTVVKHANQFP